MRAACGQALPARTGQHAGKHICRGMVMQHSIIKVSYLSLKHSRLRSDKLMTASLELTNHQVAVPCTVLEHALLATTLCAGCRSSQIPPATHDRGHTGPPGTATMLCMRSHRSPSLECGPCCARCAIVQQSAGSPLLGLGALQQPACQLLGYEPRYGGHVGICRSYTASALLRQPMKARPTKLQRLQCTCSVMHDEPGNSCCGSLLLRSPMMLDRDKARTPDATNTGLEQGTGKALTLLTSPCCLSALGTPSRPVRPGAIPNACYPSVPFRVLVTDPLHLLARGHQDVLRPQLSIACRIPARCNVSPEHCQGVAGAWPFPGTDRASLPSLGPQDDLSRPLVLVATRADAAKPPDLLF